MSNLTEYSGPLTEVILLGNIGLLAGKKVEWDAQNTRVTNDADANRWVRREYRKGWTS